MAAPMALFSTCCRGGRTLVRVGFTPFTAQFHSSCSSLLRKGRGIPPKANSSSELKLLKDETASYFPSRPDKISQRPGAGEEIHPDPPGQRTRSDSLGIGYRTSSVVDKVKRDRKSYDFAHTELNENITSHNVPRYEKAGPDDKRYKRAMMLINSRKYREQSGKIVLEGKRLIADALAAGARADTIFFSQVSNVEEISDFLQGSNVNLVKVAYKDIKMWSDLGSPQGIVGVFRKPNYDNLSLDGQAEEKLPITLICDNIRDPGNLGTILRSAAAAACQKVLLTKGCVDVWEPKVLRSGAGAHFRVPLIPNIPWPAVQNYLDHDGQVHVADCNNVPTECEDYATPPRNGTSPDNREGTSIGDNAEYESDVRTAQYFSVDWASEACAVVIGGETEGLSDEALALCENTDGKRVYIPMSMNVDSLNAAMATSIILFEAKRQMLTKLR